MPAYPLHEFGRMLPSPSALHVVMVTQTLDLVKKTFQLDHLNSVAAFCTFQINNIFLLLQNNNSIGSIRMKIVLTWGNTASQDTGLCSKCFIALKCVTLVC